MWKRVKCFSFVMILGMTSILGGIDQKKGWWKSVEQLESLNGVCYFDQCSLIELAKTYGTPLYVYSENRIRDNYKRLVNAYSKRYPKFAVYYAIKANNHPAIISILADEGANFDCSCPNEIVIAKKLGLPADKLLYTGAYISHQEMVQVLDSGVRMNVDNVAILDRFTPENVPEFLSFRINPGMGAGGSEGLIFAGEGAKFGINESQVEEAYSRAYDMGVRRFGAHMMTGSNILDIEYFENIVATLMDIIGPVAERLGITFEYINIGGSLGIPYYPGQAELDIENVAERVVSVFRKKLQEYTMGDPLLIHEPGRYLVGDAGILLTRISSIKQDKQKFVGVDAGINTLFFLEGAYRHIVYLHNLNAPCDKPTNVVGPLCTNKDIFVRQLPLPSVMKEGELLGILDVGAYGFCKSSQFNTRPRCGEVLASKGRSYSIRAPETIDDILNKTSTPKYLIRDTISN